MMRSKNNAGEEVKRWLPGVLAKVLFFSVALCWQGCALAGETVAEQLLDIMKARHEITQNQYRNLKKQAQQEKEAMKAAITRQVEKQLEARKAVAAAPQEELTPKQKAALAEQVKKQTEAEKKAQTTAIVAQVQAAQAKIEKEKNPNGFHTVWRNGIVTQSDDGLFKLHVGGYGETDFGSMTSGANLKNMGRSLFASSIGHGAEIRRLRPTVTGTLYGDIDFESQMDFGDGNTRVTNLWVRLNDIPDFGHIVIGHQKENFSLEELTSDEWTTFMERALPNTFAVGNANKDYNTGIKAYHQELDNRLTWALGAFINQSNISGSFFGNYENTDLVARVTGLPWYENKGEDLLHIGLSYSFKARKTDHPTLEYQTTPEFHLTNLNTIDTGLIPANNANTINPELGLGVGPFSLHAEYFNSMVSANKTLGYNTVSNLAGTKIHNPDFDGYYAEAAYFLTGEHRPYDIKEGIFTRTVPRNNFSAKTGAPGAWELTARVSNANLTSGGITGGDETDFTAGINWYWNPNVKLTFNYIFAHIYSRTYVVGIGSNATLKNLNNADANILATRLLFDF
jgi:phosphate-selective porin OprO/OprP